MALPAAAQTTPNGAAPAGPPAAVSLDETGLAAIARRAGRVFGTAVQGELLETMPDYAAAVAREAQILVPEFEAKWGPLQPKEGEFDFGPLGKIANWAQANRKQLRGHALIWHQDLPDWTRQALAEGPARAQAVMAAHFDKVLATTRPVIRDWDVANEVVADPPGSDTPQAQGELRDTPWLRALGPDYIALAFRLARERDRTLRLTLNDYGLEADTPWAEEKRRRLLALLRRLRDTNTPVDAVGLQAHLQMDSPFRPEVLTSFVRSLRQLDLQVLITELDVREARQIPADLAQRDQLVAQRVGEVLGAALEGGVRTVMTWGLTDKLSWLVRDPDVTRKDGQSHRGLPLDDNYGRKAMWTAMAQAMGR
jgi:endo-1,4-beta-xylanase